MIYQGKKVIIVGGSGFVGTQLALELQKQGAQIVIVDPRPSPLKSITYIKSNLQTIPDFDALRNPFAVFNLAGVPIFGRWTKVYKNKLRESRINTTRTLVQKFENTAYRPEFFISTSAIGVYGNRIDEKLNENSELKQDSFLAQLAYDWEQEALKAKHLDIEVRIVRNAHVLGKGGILGVLKKIFSLGIGGSLGKGTQYMSFVSIQKCIHTYITAPFVSSEYINAVSIEPISNAEFSKRLAKVLGVPCLFKIPIWAMYVLYGEFAREIVTSQRVYTIHNSDSENLEEVIKSVL
jgi:uncharacterized protein (TIGR01777 family)